MNYKWQLTGIGKIDNLGVQLQKVLRGANQGAIETRYRYAEACERFLKHIALKYGLQRLQNLQDKHLESYARELMEHDKAAKYIKNELSAIRYLHKQIPQAKYQLQDSKAANKKIGLSKTPDGRCDRAWTHREYVAMQDKASELGRQEIAKIMAGIRETGMRLDEACTLKRYQVEQAIRTGILHLTNTKGGRPRDVELTENAKNTLHEAIKDIPRGAYVYTPRQYWKGGIHKFESSVEKFIYNHRDKVQDQDRNLSAHTVAEHERAPLTVHGLRHMYAREEVDRKINDGKSRDKAIREVAEELGHSRESVTNIYLGQ